MAHINHNLTSAIYPNSSTTGGNVWRNIWANPSNIHTSSTWVDPSQEIMLNYLVYFILDEKYEKEQDTLTSYFKDIKKNKILFYTAINNKKFEPLETIQKIIKLKLKFDIKIQRTSHNIVIKGATFKGITNVLGREFNDTVKVSFEYDDLIYDNTLMTVEEKRSKKVNDLLKNIKRNDI